MGRAESFFNMRLMGWIYIPQFKESLPSANKPRFRVLPRLKRGSLSFSLRAKSKSLSSPQRGMSHVSMLGSLSTLNFPRHCGSRQLSHPLGALSGATRVRIVGDDPGVVRRPNDYSGVVDHLEWDFDLAIRCHRLKLVLFEKPLLGVLAWERAAKTEDVDNRLSCRELGERLLGVWPGSHLSHAPGRLNKGVLFAERFQKVRESCLVILRAQGRMQKEFSFLFRPLSYLFAQNIDHILPKLCHGKVRGTQRDDSKQDKNKCM